MQTPEEQAQSSKLRGNKFFKGGKFEQAITCYTEAIELCPKEKLEDISTFHQNRAAAYEQLVIFDLDFMLNSFIIQHLDLELICSSLPLITISSEHKYISFYILPGQATAIDIYATTGLNPSCCNQRQALFLMN